MDHKQSPCAQCGSNPDYYAEGYTVSHRRLELTGVILFALASVLCGWQWWTLVGSYEGSNLTWIVGGALVSSLLFSDWVSGFVHWLADNWGSVDLPWVGPNFVRPFRHHHVDPHAMTHHDFVELNGNNCLVSLSEFAVAWAVMTYASTETGLFWGLFLLSSAYWILGTNQFHAWAHTPNPPVWLRFLQSTRLVLHPAHHRKHHQHPHSCNYGITNGWTDPLMSGLNIYAGIEWSVRKILGAKPEHRKNDFSAETSTSFVTQTQHDG
jgi:plasmanylethanolamine desaturase